MVASGRDGLLSFRRSPGGVGRSGLTWRPIRQGVFLAIPVPAATAVLIRPSRKGPEVLMVGRPAGGAGEGLRASAGGFGGLYVFLGGVVDDVDQTGASRWVGNLVTVLPPREGEVGS